MVSSVEFANGQPVEAPNSTKSLKNIISNANNSACPDGCFRPVGLALDAKGRLFMSSDSTGEIYVLDQAEITASGEPTTSGTLVTPSATSSGNSGPHGYAQRARAYVGSGTDGGWGVLLTLMACSITGFGLLAAFPYI
jgi:hypothetical protein